MPEAHHRRRRMPRFHVPGLTAGVAIMLVSMLAAPVYAWDGDGAGDGAGDGVGQAGQAERARLVRQDSPYRHYRPDRYIGRHRQHGDSPLRYHRRHYPYDTYDYRRRTYPHTYHGTFGAEPRPDRLHLRFFYGPGYSPFSRDAHVPSDMAEPPGQHSEPESDMYESGVVTRPETGARPAPAYEPHPAPAPQRPAPRFNEVFRAPPPAEGEHREVELADTARAWSLFRDGRVQTSQYKFASLALARPDRGLPRAGYALAMAVQGEHEHAVWAMRRAFQVEGNWPRHVPADDDIARRLELLLAKYERLGRSGALSPADSAFMSAALLYLLDEGAAAAASIDRAIRAGDRDLSVLVLRALIRGQDELEAEPVPAPEAPAPVERKKRWDHRA